MGKKVLFSPIGGTDPISDGNYHDGSMLHIARHYRPDVIYMYMSKEIIAKEEKDHRYSRCIEKLGEALGHHFEIIEIRRPELKDVQLFDPVYVDFEKILDELVEGLSEEDELLLNISSGTPSMKSALLVLATMIDIPCECIQVDTPVRHMNDHHHDKDYDPDLYWESNEDNTYSEGHENYNRTHRERLISLKKLKYEETIRKFVNSYDYHAALVLALELSGDDTSEYIDKIRLADARLQMDFPAVDLLIKNQPKEIYGPIRNENSRRIYEYMLALQVRVKTKKYSDFIRAISPIFVDLLENILEKQSGLSLSSLTVERNGKVDWDREKLISEKRCLAILEEGYRSEFRFGFVKSGDLVILGKSLIQDDKITGCLEKIRKVEEEIRNPAAHTMVSVSDEWIRRRTGHTSDEILALLREAFTYSSFNVKNSQWNSYEEMNKDIIEAM